MVKRMLIDATHPEETRVVVVNGTRLEELDVETSTKKQIKGNIYLAKIVRVEPSLQAAFVDYGGNRHGFLAFSEIHPDYFQIPVADRQALLAAQNALSHRDSDEFSDVEPVTHAPVTAVIEAPPSVEDNSSADMDADGDVDAEAGLPQDLISEAGSAEPFTSNDEDAAESEAETASGDEASAEPREEQGSGTEEAEESESRPSQRVDTIGGDEAAEQELERRRARLLRNYKIQEVIKRRQIMLVQVVKEERGNKGAAMTTYLSLAGRYCVLMPNTARGGGVSRKIINAVDRKRLKAIAQEMEVPENMALIVRTAGSERSKLEIKRDYECLLRMWDKVRELTLGSTAPALTYEEGNLIKRSIRDLYSRDIDEVLVDGDEGYRMAKDYMRMLTPSHAKKVQPYRDPQVPLFHRYQVETQLDAMHSPVVQLRSGGYIVIGQTEALVAIDVNSGRATRERHIEETALKTNLEAADEVARQLRLRDLAGLIVIDFIDMEESRNNAAVERRLKEAMKNDRARIQVGRISPFGLLELSRQRLRPSLQETAFSQCPHCAGTGLIRSVESSAMAVLRAIEEEGIRYRSSEVVVHVPTSIALYLLNHKRDTLINAESRYEFRVVITIDESLIAPNFRMDRVRAEGRPEEGRQLPPPPPPIIDDEDDDVEDDEETSSETVEEGGRAQAEAPAEGSAEALRRRRRRRRNRNRPGGRPDQQPSQLDLAAEPDGGQESAEAADGAEREPGEGGEGGEGGDGGDEAGSQSGRRRRRGRRGGRRRLRNGEAPFEAVAEPVGPLTYDDVADVFEAAERAEEAAMAARAQQSVAITDSVDAVSEPVDGTEDAVATGDDVVTEAKPRRRAPRKKADESALVASEDEAPKRRRAPRKKAETVEAVADAPVETSVEAPVVVADPVAPEAAPVVIEPPKIDEPVPVVEVVPAGPPKKGWWKKLIE